LLLAIVDGRLVSLAEDLLLGVFANGLLMGSRTCANGSKQREGVDFKLSHSPAGIINSIRLIVALAASLGMQLFVLDAANAFQNSYIFDPTERVYLTLPTFYVEWFVSKWPDFVLPSHNQKDLVVQCLKSLQNTKDAGLRWYRLISGKFCSMGMISNTYNQGVFAWDWQTERCFLVIKTDDIFLAAKTWAPFFAIQKDLSKLFAAKFRRVG
jgi:hypothetical protein